MTTRSRKATTKGPSQLAALAKRALDGKAPDFNDPALAQQATEEALQGVTNENASLRVAIGKQNNIIRQLQGQLAAKDEVLAQIAEGDAAK